MSDNINAFTVSTTPSTNAAPFYPSTQSHHNTSHNHLHAHHSHNAHHAHHHHHLMGGGALPTHGSEHFISPHASMGGTVYLGDDAYPPYLYDPAQVKQAQQAAQQQAQKDQPPQEPLLDLLKKKIKQVEEEHEADGEESFEIEFNAENLMSVQLPEMESKYFGGLLHSLLIILGTFYVPYMPQRLFDEIYRTFAKPQSSQKATAKIFVGRLPGGVTFQELWCTIWAITGISIRAFTNRSKENSDAGYGFIFLDNDVEARYVEQMLHGRLLLDEKGAHWGDG